MTLVAAAAAIALSCAACGSHDKSSDHGDTTATHSKSADSKTSSSSGAGSAGGHDSAFCKLARKVGTEQLAGSGASVDPDPKELLRTINQLQALAPSDLKKDFDVFADVERGALDPGNPGTKSPSGDVEGALQHVSAYLRSPCGAIGPQ